MKNIFKQTGVLVLILLFSMASSTTVNAQTNDQELTYVKVEVKGLACPFCAYGLEKKLKEVDGVKTIKIDVEEGLAYLTVLKSKKPLKEMLEKIVTDAGFTPSSIVFSEKPFTLKDEN
jgi:copper chaperone CopZ